MEFWTCIACKNMMSQLLWVGICNCFSLQSDQYCNPWFFLCPQLPVMQYNYYITCFVCSEDKRDYALKQIEGTGISMSACREIAVSMWLSCKVAGMGWGFLSVLKNAWFILSCYGFCSLFAVVKGIEAHKCHHFTEGFSVPLWQEGVAFVWLCRAWFMGESCLLFVNGRKVYRFYEALKCHCYTWRTRIIKDAQHQPGKCMLPSGEVLRVLNPLSWLEFPLACSANHLLCVLITCFVCLCNKNTPRSATSTYVSPPPMLSPPLL